MALGQGFTARNGSFLLTASVTRTLLQILTAANTPVRIISYSVSVDSTAGSPIRVQLARQTTAGTTATITAGTHGPFSLTNPSALTPTVTLATINASAEPTTTDVIEDDYIPFGGLLKVQYPLGREPMVITAARIGILVITPAATTPNCSVTLQWEE